MILPIKHSVKSATVFHFQYIRKYFVAVMKFKKKKQTKRGLYLTMVNENA